MIRAPAKSCWLALAFQLLCFPLHATPLFQGLGKLPTTGAGFNSTAQSISADGSTVVGRSNEAYRWTSATGMIGLGDFAGGNLSSSAMGVSVDGSVIVGSGLPPNNKSMAFRWASATGLVPLGFLSVGDYFSGASAVSGDGSVVVGTSQWEFGQQAFRWSEPTGMVGLNPLSNPNIFSRANAESGNGSIVVGGANFGVGETQAFRWTQTDGMINLGALLGPSYYSEAFGISDDGSAIVGRTTTSAGRQAFVQTQSTGMQSLGGIESLAFDTSADGAVIVGFNEFTKGFAEAFIWDALAGMRKLEDVLTSAFALDLTGWTLVDARGISADGTAIVGLGINPEGVSEGWIARLNVSTVPEPGTSLLTLIGFAFLGYFHWRLKDVRGVVKARAFR